MDIFGKETSVELGKLLLQESSQSNHLSPEPPFLVPRPRRLKGTNGSGEENGGEGERQGYRRE